MGGWADGYRFRRIRSRLEAEKRHTANTIGAIHADVYHARVEEAKPSLVAILASGNRELRWTGEILSEWDGAFIEDSIAPTIFTVFWETWLRQVTGMRFPDALVSLVAGRVGRVALRLLKGERPGWLPDGRMVDQEVHKCMGEALSWLRERVGPRRSQWRWGRLHTVTFRHPISDSEALSKVFDRGPFETSGGTGTVRAAGCGMEDLFEVTGLSSYRMVVDLGDAARSWAVTTGGQSGHPGSEHYADHIQLWLDDGYHPLLMDEEDIDRNLEGELWLRS